MLKKKSVFFLVSVLSCNSFAYNDANSWNPAPIESINTFFISFEGSYTRNSFDNFFINIRNTDGTLYSTKQDQFFGGRAAAGIMGGVTNVFAFTGEMGGGYYGNTRLNPLGTGIFSDLPDIFTITNTITAFDALVGLAYTQPCYNVFFKTGALVEQVKTRIIGHFFDPADPAIDDPFNFRINKIHALPAIKVGGTYQLNKNLGLTVAYMHAFGAASGEAVRFVDTFESVLLASTFDDNLENPSLDSIMIGVNIQFCRF